MFVRVLSLAVGLWCFTGAVSAQEAYRCRKSDGSILYSNVLQGDSCERVETAERFIAPAGAVGSRGRKGASSSRSSSRRASSSGMASVPSSAGPNHVQPQVQMTRDQKRRSILEEELDIEQKNLSNARAELSRQQLELKRTKQPASLAVPQQQKVEQHQRNIEALRRELSRVSRG